MERWEDPFKQPIEIIVADGDMDGETAQPWEMWIGGV